VLTEWHVCEIGLPKDYNSIYTRRSILYSLQLLRPSNLTSEMEKNSALKSVCSCLLHDLHHQLELALNRLPHEVCIILKATINTGYNRSTTLFVFHLFHMHAQQYLTDLVLHDIPTSPLM
jgi:hypothetical protein